MIGKLSAAVALTVMAVPAPSNLTLLAQTPSTVTVGWTAADNVASYQFYEDGKKLSNAGPKAVQAKFGVSNGVHTLGVQSIAKDGTTQLSSMTVNNRWQVTAVVYPPPPVPPKPTGCFAVPSSCKYPDLTNTGVPAGTTLTPSGQLVLETAGQTISGLDITGQSYGIYIDAANVTVKNSRITVSGGIGSAAIRLGANASNITIEYSTIQGSGPNENQTVQVGTSGATLIGDQITNCGECISGSATVTDSYIAVTPGTITSEHYENVYLSGGSSLVANHDTFFNPQPQTAIVFGDSGSGSTCSNQITITNSLLAGGGWMIYQCSGATSVGSATLNVTGNLFSRGYFSGGGAYGVAAYTFCPPTPNQTWTQNVWDDGTTVQCLLNGLMPHPDFLGLSSLKNHPLPPFRR